MCHILYSWKIWQVIKFGSLAVYLWDNQIKIHQYFILAYTHMTIPYRTAKFNSRQYFRLYGGLVNHLGDIKSPAVWET